MQGFVVADGTTTHTTCCDLPFVWLRWQWTGITTKEEQKTTHYASCAAMPTKQDMNKVCEYVCIFASGFLSCGVGWLVYMRIDDGDGCLICIDESIYTTVHDNGRANNATSLECLIQPSPSKDTPSQLSRLLPVIRLCIPLSHIHRPPDHTGPIPGQLHYRGKKADHMYPIKIWRNSGQSHPARPLV